MKRCIQLLALLLSASTLSAADTLPLWPTGAPGARGTNDVDVPTLTLYPADPLNASGAAMVIFPGGGYGGLAGHEGADYALWFNKHGISSFVLRYRLGSSGYRHPAMLQDAARAVRLVRSKAEDWKIDSRRVGIIGSSAGGHLASTLLTHFDPGDPAADDPIERHSSRPDLGILCYPVISMGPNTHQGSRNNLLGSNPSPDLVQLLSNELQVTAQTPPTFLWHTAEDTVVKVENSMEFAAALQKSGVPFALHIYQKGRHGLGLASKPPLFEDPHPWAQNCLYWLRVQEFLPQPLQ